LHDPLTPGAAYYAEALGWPVSMEAGHPVVQCGSVLDVLAMPAALAAEVNHLLKLHLLACPVVEVLAGRTVWAFLCEPRSRTATDKPLAHHEIEYFGAGKTFPLPPGPASSSGSPRWVEPPRLGAEHNLPPLTAVLSCVFKATRR
jgi:hypothetical protein